MTDTTHRDSSNAVVLDGADSGEAIKLDEDLLVDADAQPSNETAWSGLSLQIPNEVPRERISSFVECVLIELTHEPVGAVCRENAEWGTVETITIHTDWTSLQTSESFLRYRRDPRIGTYLWTDSWDTIREQLIERLHREGSATSVVVADSFGVHPLSSILRWN